MQVKPFLNHSAEPGLADDLTSALRQSVQEDGTFHLTTDGSSDLIVNGTITDYRRRELSLLSEDIRTVRDYQVSLIVHVIVTERASGRAVLERDVKGGTLVRVADDLAATERQAAPILTRDLARQITHLIVDGEW